jgi:hypothetical protein
METKLMKYITERFQDQFTIHDRNVIYDNICSLQKMAYAEGYQKGCEDTAAHYESGDDVDE